MPTPTTSRPDRKTGGLLLLIGTATAAALPHGCAAPAWRDILCATAAAAGAFVLLRHPGSSPALNRAQAGMAAAAVLVLVLHAGLAAAGVFPDATAVAEAFAFRAGMTAFAFAAAIALRDPRARRTVAAAAASVAVFQIAIGLFAPDPLDASSISSSGRLRGTFSSGNSLGSFLALVLPLLTGWLPRLVYDRGLTRQRILQNLQKGDIRHLLPAAGLAAALLISAAGLVLTGSRGAQLAGLAGCALALAPYTRQLSGKIRIALPLGLLAVFAALALSGGRFSIAAARWENIVGDNEAGRTEIWKGLAPLLREHPLGVGMGGLRVVAHMVQPSFHTTKRLLEAHCDPFEVLLEFGPLPGGVILAALLLLAGPPLLRAPSGEPGVRAGMAGAVLAGLLHSLVDFNLLWRPGVSFWFLLCLGGILHTQPTRPGGLLARRTVAAIALAGALASAWLGLQHFRSEWWREKTGGRRDAAMVWIVDPPGRVDTMPVPALTGMTADAAARMASAWITLHDRLDQAALEPDPATSTRKVPVTGIFFARQFRWSEHLTAYAAIARNADRVLTLAPGNAEIRLIRDKAANRAWLASVDDRPAPSLPADPESVSRLLRIRAAYASLWLDQCRREPSALATARRWMDSLPDKHPARDLLEDENADILATPP